MEEKTDVKIADPKDYPLNKFSASAVLKIILASGFGIFAFFVSFAITPNGGKTILVDHIANGFKFVLGDVLVPWFCVIMMIIGAIQPFYKKTWNKDVTTMIFTLFKIVGVPLGFMYLFKLGPSFLYEPGKMIDFLFVKLVMSLSFVIPVGSALIVFLTDYGLMEFTGVFANPFMRPVYKTPGRSAIDAVASFVGSYSIALLITGKQYREGYYTKKETAIIATGFSTVSASFCVIVAKTLGLLENHWNVFFWGALLVTFIVTAITVRLYPLSKTPNEYAEGVTPIKDPNIKGHVFLRASYEGLTQSSKSVPIFKNIAKNLLTGFSVTVGLTPSIMSVGLAGLLLAEFTPVFNILGYIFYPFTLLFQFPEAKVVADALSMGIAEMFLPAAPVAGFESLVVRYVVGVACISEILFFSASIPCMVSMGIPFSIKNMVIVWYERVVLTIIIATPLAWLLFR